MKSIRWLVLMCVVTAGVLSGCASVPMSSPEADASAKRFQPRPGVANIYLYRNETFGAAIAMTVSLDGKVMGRTGPQTFFLWEVPPGRHEVQSHTENLSTLAIDVEAGRSYYVWQEVKMGMWQPGSLLQLMPEAEGRKGVLECQRAAEN